MQVLRIVTKLLKYAFTGNIKNHKAEVYYTGIGHDCEMDVHARIINRDLN